MNYVRKKSLIPQEIMFEIFLWLPVKSSMHLKCVSTFCKSIVSESDFFDIHRCRSRKKDGKVSTSLLQVDRFNKIYNRVRTYSHLSSCVLRQKNNCKVFSTTYHSQEGYIKYQIFTLGIDKLWRETQSIFHGIPSGSSSVCISGVIYQLIYYAFDVKSETFEIIAFKKAFGLVHYHELIEVKGKLTIIDYERKLSGYMDIWILEHNPRKQ
ncbi:hypothetical protein R3W88_031947 [Solanum pinnatisectum]|uniref:F-box domain-containing protein n=1 Tax=Solanum pinnatisectum TaxID=50273 RepID=A0AAV9LMR8_9SOLN|nr:hypothetical protein R3W88_031947 [Solanum pinnatisectum]